MSLRIKTLEGGCLLSVDYFNHCIGEFMQKNLFLARSDNFFVLDNERAVTSFYDWIL